MQDENIASNEGVPHQLRHAPAVDNFRSQRLKRGDSVRMAQYVYSENDYNNATTDGGRLEGEGFSMRDDTTSTTSPLSGMTSNTSQASTIGIATAISGITAEGEAMRHGGGSFGSQPSHVPQQQPQQLQRQQYAPPPQSHNQQYAQPQTHQDEHQQPQSTHHPESRGKSESRFGDEGSEPVSPKATGYQQPFFSRPIKGASRG